MALEYRSLVARSRQGDQQTLRSDISLAGIGVHTGQPAELTLRSAPPDTGVRFLSEGEEIELRLEHVVDDLGGITLGKNGHKVRTIEHLLAAVHLFGVDNLIAEVNGPEVPILDGSAAPFLEAFKQAGRVRQAAPRWVYRVAAPGWVIQGDRMALALPNTRLRVSYYIDYEVIGRQYYAGPITGQTFERKIAPSRTFGFLKDAPGLRAQGRALGSSLENTVAIGQDGPLTTLRSKDEFVKHKVLDLLGDLLLGGRRLIGGFVVLKGGHHLHRRLVNKLLRSSGRPT
ncbi:MAG: UDP-3-O-acyl-N-acetylglucosamine deacetylase [Candidatus Bipolaricaulia bacterium]